MNKVISVMLICLLLVSFVGEVSASAITYEDTVDTRIRETQQEAAETAAELARRKEAVSKLYEDYKKEVDKDKTLQFAGKVRGTATGRDRVGEVDRYRNAAGEVYYIDAATGLGSTGLESLLATRAGKARESWHADVQEVFNPEAVRSQGVILSDGSFAHTDAQGNVAFPNALEGSTLFGDRDIRGKAEERVQYQKAFTASLLARAAKEQAEQRYYASQRDQEEIDEENDVAERARIAQLALEQARADQSSEFERMLRDPEDTDEPTDDEDPAALYGTTGQAGLDLRSIYEGRTDLTPEQQDALSAEGLTINDLASDRLSDAMLTRILVTEGIPPAIITPTLRELVRDEIARGAVLIPVNAMKFYFGGTTHELDLGADHARELVETAARDTEQRFISSPSFTQQLLDVGLSPLISVTQKPGTDGRNVEDWAVNFLPLPSFSSDSLIPPELEDPFFAIDRLLGTSLSPYSRETLTEADIVPLEEARQQFIDSLSALSPTEQKQAEATVKQLELVEIQTKNTIALGLAPTAAALGYLEQADIPQIIAENKQELKDFKETLDMSDPAHQVLAVQANLAIVQALGLEADLLKPAVTADTAKGYLVLGERAHSAFDDAEDVGRQVTPDRTMKAHYSQVGDNKLVTGFSFADAQGNDLTITFTPEQLSATNIESKARGGLLPQGLPEIIRTFSALPLSERSLATFQAIVSDYAVDRSISSLYFDTGLAHTPVPSPTSASTLLTQNLAEQGVYLLELRNSPIISSQLEGELLVALARNARALGLSDEVRDYEQQLRDTSTLPAPLRAQVAITQAIDLKQGTYDAERNAVSTDIPAALRSLTSAQAVDPGNTIASSLERSFVSEGLQNVILGHQATSDQIYNNYLVSLGSLSDSSVKNIVLSTYNVFRGGVNIHPLRGLDVDAETHESFLSFQRQGTVLAKALHDKNVISLSELGALPKEQREYYVLSAFPDLTPDQAAHYAELTMVAQLNSDVALLMARGDARQQRLYANIAFTALHAQDYGITQQKFFGTLSPDLAYGAGYDLGRLGLSTPVEYIHGFAGGTLNLANALFLPASGALIGTGANFVLNSALAARYIPTFVKGINYARTSLVTSEGVQGVTLSAATEGAVIARAPTLSFGQQVGSFFRSELREELLQTTLSEALKPALTAGISYSFGSGLAESQADPLSLVAYSALATVLTGRAQPRLNVVANGVVHTSTGTTIPTFSREAVLTAARQAVDATSLTAPTLFGQPLTAAGSTGNVDLYVHTTNGRPTLIGLTSGDLPTGITEGTAVTLTMPAGVDLVAPAPFTVQTVQQLPTEALLADLAATQAAAPTRDMVTLANTPNGRVADARRADRIMRDEVRDAEIVLRARTDIPGETGLRTATLETVRGTTLGRATFMSGSSGDSSLTVSTVTADVDSVLGRTTAGKDATVKLLNKVQDNIGNADVVRVRLSQGDVQHFALHGLLPRQTIASNDIIFSTAFEGTALKASDFGDYTPVRYVQGSDGRWYVDLAKPGTDLVVLKERLGTIKRTGGFVQEGAELVDYALELEGQLYETTLESSETLFQPLPARSLLDMKELYDAQGTVIYKNDILPGLAPSLQKKVMATALENVQIIPQTVFERELRSAITTQLTPTLEGRPYSVLVFDGADSSNPWVTALAAPHLPRPASGEVGLGVLSGINSLKEFNQRSPILQSLLDQGQRDFVIFDDASYSGGQLQRFLTTLTSDLDSLGHAGDTRIHVVVPYTTSYAQTAIRAAPAAGLFDSRIFIHSTQSIPSVGEIVRAQPYHTELSPGFYVSADSHALTVFEHKLPDSVSSFFDFDAFAPQYRTFTGTYKMAYEKGGSAYRNALNPLYTSWRDRTTGQFFSDGFTPFGNFADADIPRVGQLTDSVRALQAQARAPLPSPAQVETAVVELEAEIPRAELDQAALLQTLRSRLVMAGRTSNPVAFSAEEQVRMLGDLAQTTRFLEVTSQGERATLKVNLVPREGFGTLATTSLSDFETALKVLGERGVTVVVDPVGTKQAGTPYFLSNGGKMLHIDLATFSNAFRGVSQKDVGAVYRQAVALLDSASFEGTLAHLTGNAHVTFPSGKTTSPSTVIHEFNSIRDNLVLLNQEGSASFGALTPEQIGALDTFQQRLVQQDFVDLRREVLVQAQLTSLADTFTNAFSFAETSTALERSNTGKATYVYYAHPLDHDVARDTLIDAFYLFDSMVLRVRSEEANVIVNVQTQLVKEGPVTSFEFTVSDPMFVQLFTDFEGRTWPGGGPEQHMALHTLIRSPHIAGQIHTYARFFEEARSAVNRLQTFDPDYGLSLAEAVPVTIATLPRASQDMARALERLVTPSIQALQPYARYRDLVNRFQSPAVPVPASTTSTGNVQPVGASLLTTCALCDLTVGRALVPLARSKHYELVSDSRALAVPEKYGVSAGNIIDTMRADRDRLSEETDLGSVSSPSVQIDTLFAKLALAPDGETIRVDDLQAFRRLLPDVLARGRAGQTIFEAEAVQALNGLKQQITSAQQELVTLQEQLELDIGDKKNGAPIEQSEIDALEARIAQKQSELDSTFERIFAGTQSDDVQPRSTVPFTPYLRYAREVSTYYEFLRGRSSVRSSYEGLAFNPLASAGIFSNEGRAAAPANGLAYGILFGRDQQYRSPADSAKLQAYVEGKVDALLAEAVTAHPPAQPAELQTDALTSTQTITAGGGSITGNVVGEDGIQRGTFVTLFGKVPTVDGRGQVVKVRPGLAEGQGPVMTYRAGGDGMSVDFIMKGRASTPVSVPGTWVASASTPFAPEVVLSGDVIDGAGHVQEGRVYYNGYRNEGTWYAVVDSEGNWLLTHDEDLVPSMSVGKGIVGEFRVVFKDGKIVSHTATAGRVSVGQSEQVFNAMVQTYGVGGTR